jgi:hypothetical protein
MTMPITGGAAIFLEKEFGTRTGKRQFFVGARLNHSPTPTAFILSDDSSEPKLRLVAYEICLQGKMSR